MSNKEPKEASLWAQKPKPEHDVLEGVEIASQAPPASESSKAADEQRKAFREHDLSDLANYLVR